jgi:hypothetical protein
MGKAGIGRFPSNIRSLLNFSDGAFLFSQNLRVFIWWNTRVPLCGVVNIRQNGTGVGSIHHLTVLRHPIGDRWRASKVIDPAPAFAAPGDALCDRD